MFVSVLLKLSLSIYSYDVNVLSTSLFLSLLTTLLFSKDKYPNKGTNLSRSGIITRPEPMSQTQPHR